MTPVVQQFWDAFKATQTDDVEDRFFEVCVFDDNEPSANHLAELVVRGIKRATAGLVWSFEAGDQVVPKPGDLSVVTTWDGQPKCVIETTQVDITPFSEVTAEFAAVEGEGDGSLQYWREAHAAYYARECVRIGRVPGPSMPVACERFKVVYCPSIDNAA
ncbi:ASCH domain-containing protein [Pelomonas sp. V22]|uniref:ASCH domain-containing protein n=1 Tax=Pelomonas sp. V22 TaxID=2822139 RepID=UPI0024A80878|nr:ASCH domain-containing protein [Pelomonas sp. V22]MDI4634570.1 ASCH domain-containing protein [Pelomonas sp. V22]